MKKVTRGWSDKFSNGRCKQCQESTKHEIVQYQPKINVGPLLLLGSGPREYGKECTQCFTLTDLKTEGIKNASKLKYFDKRPTKSSNTLLLNSKQDKKRIKYQVLTNKQRIKIKAHNKKEGLQSLSIGVVIGFIVAYWSTQVAVVLLFIFILGGLYAIYEDPERKHRDFLKAGKTF